MKKYRITVTLTKEYEVEVDENLYNEEWKKNFERYMWELPDGEILSESIAKALAEQSARLGVNTFLEGFGKCAPDKETAEKRGGRDGYVEGLYISQSDEWIESEAEED